MHIENTASQKAELVRLLLEKKGIRRADADAIPRAKQSDHYPLSFAQQRLWFLDQFEPGSARYNMPHYVRLTGPFELAALERAFNEIVRRQAILRTSFATRDEAPVQLIAPHAPRPLSLVDLSALTTEKRERVAKRLAAREAVRPFDLSFGPLVRATVLKLAAEDHVFLLTLHHIISDGWSLGVLVREVKAVYAAYLAGEESPLAALNVQYADYAVWQREWLQGAVLERQLGYWKEQLRDAPRLLELPADRAWPVVQSHKAGRFGFTVPAELLAGLQELSRAEGATLFMTLLAVWQVLLSRYSGQVDVSVGTPIANRNRADTEGLIGFFVNTLVLRTDLSDAPAFAELLGRVKEVCLGAYGHQDVPFEMLVEELQPERSMSYSPLFQVMFTLQNALEEAAELSGLKLRPFGTGTRTAKFDLTLALTETKKGLVGEIEYQARLFAAETIERMAGHYQRLLAGVVANPQQRIAELPLLSEAESTQLLVEWNATAVEFANEKCMHELFAEQALQRPDAVALVHHETHLTYAELNERAECLARRLRALGVGPEVRVGLLLERSVELVVATLATLKAGGAYVPLDPQHPEERLQDLVTDSEIKIVVTESRIASTLRLEAEATLVLLDKLELTTEAEPTGPQMATSEEARRSTDQLAYVIHTSGSTGKPKGVCVTHGSLANLINWHHQTYLISPQDRAALMAASTFDAAVLELWSYLTAGLTVLIPTAETRQSLPLLLPWLAEEQITVCFLPTPLAELVLSEPLPANLSLRLLLTGGDQLRLWPPAGLPFQVINNYGPTETSVVATVSTVERKTKQEGLPSIGRPISNVCSYVLDEHLQPVPQGVTGELYLGGAGVGRGYLNVPELTAEKFLPNPFATKGGERLYRTGDSARYLADGELEFLGRRDQQVKVRGFRIELGEIEAALAQHPRIRECAIVVGETGQQQLVAYVVLQNEAIEIRELRQYLKIRLPEYMVPSLFITLDKLPLTRSGKVDRRALPAPDKAAAATAESIAPRTAAEQVVAEIFAQVLRVERVGVTDNFFELGGHSLLATRVILRLMKTFQVEVPLRKLFETPTVEGLVEALVDEHGARDAVEQIALSLIDTPQISTHGRVDLSPHRNGTKVWSPLIRIKKGSTNPPLFCVHPVEGDVSCYVALAKHLDAEQAVYGLRARGLDSSHEAHTRIEDMAVEYVKALREVQPAGPYLLCGWSMGGTIAFEMSLLLAEQGETVAFLGMIDVASPHLSREQLATTNIEDLVTSLGARSNGADSSTTDPHTPNADPHAQLKHQLRTNISALQRYTPRGKTRRITLLTTENSANSTTDATLGWQSLSVEKVNLLKLPGTHYSIMLEPAVVTLAQHFTASLALPASTT